MKHLLAIGAVSVAAGALAACGGGGGGSTPSIPVTQPTTAPTTAPVVYSAQIRWLGTGATGSAYERLAQGYRDIRDASIASPVIMIVPTSPLFAGANGSGATLLVAVSPQPSTTPSPVTFTDTTPNVAAASAQPTPPQGYVAAKAIVANNPSGAGAGTVTANIGSPVNTSATNNEIVYKALRVGCGESDLNPALAVADNGDTTPVTDPLQADIYSTSSACSGAFYAASGSAEDGIIHAPYGAVVIAEPSGGYSAVASTAFTGTAKTELTNADTSIANAVLFKTKDGTICKFRLFVGGSGNDQGPISCHGTGPDGF